MRCKKLLQISAGVFFYGVRRPAPGSGFAHQNGEQRVCGEPSANRVGAAAGKKGNPGSGFAHQNGEQRVCGEPSANRAGAAAGKKENSGYGFAHQNGEQRVCGEPSANPAGKKKPPPFVSEWGKRRRHIRIIQFWVPRKTVAGANVFLWGVKR